MLFTFAQIFGWLAGFRYWMLFPVAVIEGPIITVIAGFLSSLGALDLLISYSVVVMGDLAGDSLYYAIGRFGRERFILKWGKYIGLKIERVRKMESQFKKRGKAILIGGKMSQVFGALILVSAGISKMKYKDFMLTNFVWTLPKSFILILIGFYFGQAYVQINRYFNYTAVIMFALGVAAAVIYWLIRKYISRIYKID